MIAFFKPATLFSDRTESKAASHKDWGSTKGKSNFNSAVVVFAHHRDVKVALDELDSAGFSHDNLTLIARQAKRCVGYSEIITHDWFDRQQFDYDRISQELFLRLFNRGKYLVLVNGSQADVNAATKIMSRRRDRAKVWRVQQLASKN